MILEEINRITNIMGISEGVRNNKKFQFIVDNVLSQLKSFCDDNNENISDDTCSKIKSINHIKITDASLGKHKKYILLYSIYYTSENTEYDEFNDVNYHIMKSIEDKTGLKTEIHSSSYNMNGENS